jgi:hypothetical protein
MGILYLVLQYLWKDCFIVSILSVLYKYEFNDIGDLFSFIVLSRKGVKNSRGK